MSTPPPRGTVYVTGLGRVCPRCSRPVAACSCAAAKGAAGSTTGGGVVKLRCDSKNRRGKTMTIVEGLALDPAKLDELATQLKKACGTGGTVAGATIELQGDQRERLEAELTRRGYRVKRAGG